MPNELHQFLTGATAGDAITGQALIIRRWLRELGFKSHIYAQYIHRSMETEVRHLSSYRKSPKGDWAIYHHSIGSDLPQFLKRQKPRLMLIYHNITPTPYFVRSDPGRAELARMGLQQLQNLKSITELAVAVSPFNRLDLQEAGYAQAEVLPITLRPEDYDWPDNETLVEQLSNGGPTLLFVGRLAPNKKQEDLVRLLTYCRRLNPEIRLILVGDRWEIGYDTWVEQMAEAFGVADGLTLTGKVSQQDLVTYYRHASIYVSMSEHEGFGVPLIESMYLGLPVMAYAASAVPDTMGPAGLLFYEKEFERLAELVSLLLDDQALRKRLIERQYQRIQDYLEPNVKKKFLGYLQQAGILQIEKSGAAW